MKLMFISDIHGSFTDLQQAIKIFKEENASKLIILGDYLNHGPRNPLPEGYDTKQTAALLNENKANIIGIRGNCDSEVDQMMLDFSVLESNSRIFLFDNSKSNSLKGLESQETSIFLHHGHQLSQENLFAVLPKNSIVFSGHTHIPLLEKKEEIIFANPGSISIPKNEDGKCYGILTFENQQKSIQIKGLFDLSVKKCLLF